MKCLISLLLVLVCGLCFGQSLTVETVYHGFDAVADTTGQSFYIQISKVVIDKETNQVYCHFDAFNSMDDFDSGKKKISTKAFAIPLSAELQMFIDSIFQTAYQQVILHKEYIPNFSIETVNSETLEVIK